VVQYFVSDEVAAGRGKEMLELKDANMIDSAVVVVEVVVLVEVVLVPYTHHVFLLDRSHALVD
jgi:hypothetical protein